MNDAWLDAIALINAKRRRDEAACAHVLSTADPDALAHVLAQMVVTGVRTQGMDIDGFLDMQAEKTVAHRRADREGL